MANLPSPDHDLIERHLAWCRTAGMTAATLKGRGYTLHRLAGWLRVGLLEATPAVLASWTATYAGRAPATIAVYTSHTREFYAWLESTGQLVPSPAAGLPVPRIGRRLPRPVPEADAMAAVRAAPPRVRAWLALAGWAGLRCCEIAGVQRIHVHDHATPPILLVPRENAKGRRERIVPLSPWVLDQLRPHLRAAPRGYLFPKRDGSGPVTPAAVSVITGLYLREHGIPASAHMFRHRFGSRLYQQTHDLRQVQELMGHASTRSTEGYVAWDAAGAAAAVAALPVP